MCHWKPDGGQGADVVVRGDLQLNPIRLFWPVQPLRMLRRYLEPAFRWAAASVSTRC